ncbi:hypothetical protein I6M70_03200 [Acinetobacter pittii]|uniref:hypothetical protein n=1 Tax=Acinetobacter pittii TaxID=48296 RepID=UPI0019014FDB|nr:hypothetical protein [Acinetobacter pittii]MBJ8478375.1 hypothetical protein [Acinetobacter pittii]
MKQTLLVETNDAGKFHILELIKEGKLNSLKMEIPIKTVHGHAIYFKRLNFSTSSVSELNFLKSSLTLIGGQFKFEYINTI